MGLFSKVIRIESYARSNGYDKGFILSAGFVRDGPRIRFFVATSPSDLKLVQELNKAHVNARERRKQLLLEETSRRQLNK